MTTITLASVMQVDFPDGTVRWADGGFVNFGGQSFLAIDPVWGVLTGADEIGEGMGSEVPGFRFTCTPPDTTPIPLLLNAENNGARVRLWTLELDPQTQAVVASDLSFDGMIGGCRAILGKERTIEFAVVSMLERLFMVNGGNRLDPTYHKAMWPSERGEDNASGVPALEAWGAPSPAISA